MLIIMNDNKLWRFLMSKAKYRTLGSIASACFLFPCSSNPILLNHTHWDQFWNNSQLLPHSPFLLLLLQLQICRGNLPSQHVGLHRMMVFCNTKYTVVYFWKSFATMARLLFPFPFLLWETEVCVLWWRKNSMADIRYMISLALYTVAMDLFTETDVLSYLCLCCMERVPHPIPPNEEELIEEVGQSMLNLLYKNLFLV